MIKRKKKWNDAGQERILFAIVFLATMIFTTAFLITAMYPIEYISVEQPNVPKGWLNLNVTLWNPTDGYIMNASRVMNSGSEIFDTFIISIHGLRWDYLKSGTHKIADFWPNGGNANDNTNVLVYAIEGQNSQPNNYYEWKRYSHYFALYRHTGLWDEFFDAISYDTILENANGNMSTAIAHLDRDYLFMIYCPASNITYTSFEEAFNAHDYYIYLGQNWENISREMQQADFFSIIGMMLTFSLPGVPPLVSIIIAVPCWIAIGFVIFTMIERLIPG